MLVSRIYKWPLIGGVKKWAEFLSPVKLVSLPSMQAYSLVQAVVQVLSVCLAFQERVWFLLHSVGCAVLGALMVPGMKPVACASPSTRRTHVLVTGCSSGIGRATAIELACRGYHVFASVRRQVDADSLTDEFNQCCTTKLPYAKIEPVIMDVSKSDEVKTALNQVSHSLGNLRLYAIVNNAASTAAIDTIDSVDLDQVLHVFDVNVFGVLRIIQAFLPLLQGQTNSSTPTSRIINVGSMAAWHTAVGMGIYCSSKAALEMATRALKLELSLLTHSIPVSIVSPGAINTPAWDKLDTQGAQLRTTDSLVRLGQALSFPPTHVTRNIIHALESHWPKSHYYVGYDAMVASTLSEVVVDTMLMGVYRVLAYAQGYQMPTKTLFPK
jgi:NAD(P)-dependent dehydrogenase (short-subunit alcohol dehydrogenase family)